MKPTDFIDPLSFRIIPLWGCDIFGLNGMPQQPLSGWSIWDQDQDFTGLKLEIYLFLTKSDLGPISNTLENKELPHSWGYDFFFLLHSYLPCLFPFLSCKWCYLLFSTVISDFYPSNDSTSTAAVTAVNTPKNRKPACHRDDKERLVGSLFSCCYLYRRNGALINQKRRDTRFWTLLLSPDRRQNSVIFHCNQLSVEWRCLKDWVFLSGNKKNAVWM